MASELVTWLAGEVYDAAIHDAVKRVFRKRLETARAILLDELETGKANLADVADKDEAAAMVFDYAGAAVKGTARRNLRMIAQLICGQLATPPVYPDTFIELHRTLAELTWREIIVLSKYHRTLALQQQKKANTLTLVQIRDQTIKESICENHNDFLSIISGLVAKGFLVQLGNTTAIDITPKFFKLVNLINFDTVFAEPDR